MTPALLPLRRDAPETNALVIRAAIDIALEEGGCPLVGGAAARDGFVWRVGSTGCAF